MLSIIICSVSLERLRAVQQNIKETIGIGVDYEIIAIDNREKHWPIAKVYNHGASQAKYPYLFFVHEDVKFHSQGWAEFIEQKLAEPDCGVIGFAGSKVKLRAYSGWGQRYEWICSCYYQSGDGDTRFEFNGVAWDKPFEEVVTLDGFAMFVRKTIWEQNTFDESQLTGFHCYDIDFSLQVALKNKNYVCSSQCVLIEHFSRGNYNERWFADTIRLHRQKWNNILPLKTADVTINEVDIRKAEEVSYYGFLYKLLRTEGTDKRNVLAEFWSLPFSWIHLRHCLTCTLKYLRTL